MGGVWLGYMREDRNWRGRTRSDCWEIGGKVKRHAKAVTEGQSGFQVMQRWNDEIERFFNAWLGATNDQSAATRLRVRLIEGDHCPVALRVRAGNAGSVWFVYPAAHAAG
jgi:hypothetical protein